MTTLLCYGDSNTWGFDPATQTRLPREQRWPGVVQARLPPTCQVIEEALCGRTTLQDDPFEVGRNGLSYLVPCLASHQPVDVVVLLLGTNDVKSFFPFEAAAIAAGAGRLVQVILGSGAGPSGGAPRVLLVAPAPVVAARPLTRVWGFDEVAERRSRELAGFYRAVADNRGCAFLDAGTVVQASPIDGVHLDAAAQARLGAAVAERVLPLLGA
jgi:lysophospholipase L1-like esterase